MVVDGLAVGLLRVSERESAVFIDQVEITPKYQGQGIGTSLINDLLARGRPVDLGVLKVNVDARRFYERLGFRVTGETETHYNMRADRYHPTQAHSHLVGKAPCRLRTHPRSGKGVSEPPFFHDLCASRSAFS